MNAPPPLILVVDDDDLVAASLAAVLERAGFRVEVEHDGDSGIAAVHERNPELVLLDVRLPGKNGIEVLREIKRSHPRTPVLIMTAYGSIDNTVSAMREGAHDYLTKPLDDADLLRRIHQTLSESRLHSRTGEADLHKASISGFETLVANHPRMQDVLRTVEAAAPTRATILIQGESGTGKTVLARAIHQMSGRRDSPFVEVSCGSLPDPLLESELFGYEAGAFTGATRTRRGKFEVADSGTIFLDEIANATPALQVKLLRVLQDRVFERLGGNDPIGTDIRLLLATNADLQKMMNEGKFREDLFYRINVVALSMPPLRERRDDIPALADLFLNRYADEHGKSVTGFAPEVLEFFHSFDWPGNVRELENVVEHAVIMAQGDLVVWEHLPPRYSESQHDTKRQTGVRPLKEALEVPERELILKALKLNDGNRQRTAEMLCVNRTTLFNKMRKYGLFDEPT